MREIKFRAWDKKKRTMLWDDDFVISEGKPVSVFGGEMDFRIDGILMQYTGLKDKNGKEIYEGDILRISAAANDKESWINPVEFEDGCFIVREAFSTMLFCVGQEACNLEVIGDIYENPELLNPVKN